MSGCCGGGGAAASSCGCSSSNGQAAAAASSETTTVAAMNDFFGDAGDCDGDDHQRAMERRTMERLKATARRRGFMDEEQRREAETIAKSFSDGFASGMEEAIAQVQQFIQSNAKQQ